ncbi:MAG: type II secretion system protein GspE, partial [Pusillimonas sp.]|nr:type II secretion system protein GspE [Pusillimonas sp.]
MIPRVPYTWAQAHRALIQATPDGAAAVLSERASGWVLTELRRRFGELTIRRIAD